MEHQTPPTSTSPRYSLKDFIPLLAIGVTIIVLALTAQWYRGWDWQYLMSDFMGFFFLIFGGFKMLNWQGFVEAFSMYDIFARRSMLYAYAYPIIELLLGLSYLVNFAPVVTNSATLVLMLVGAAGVWQELKKDRAIPCACLGVVFKLPMTYVTLAEDLLMAVMALVMLLHQYNS